MSQFCVFCEIMMGSIPARKVYENEKTIVLGPLPEDCLSRGHLLVIPRAHYENIFDAPKEILHEVITTVRYISKRLKRSGYCDGLNIINANETCAGQSVPHLHFHLVPRHIDDGADFWPKSEFRELDADRTYTELTTLLNQ